MEWRWCAFLLLVLTMANVRAEEAAPDDDLKRKVEVLTEEVERLKAGNELFPDAKEGKYGMGPGASKVYSKKKGVSLGGYGEFLYANPNSDNESGLPSGEKSQIDALRAVLYVGYKFSDHILFNSETEFEHSTTEGAGDVSVEFAYIDFLIREWANVRAGLLLVPMGLYNEMHEPTTFLPTLRPETERRIIPSTWREVGVGFFGNAANVAYRLYVVNGLDGVGGGSSGASGFSSAGLRDGRQHGSEALAENWAVIGRADYERIPGFRFGLSGYVGNSGQGNELTPGDEIDALTTIVEGHVDGRYRGLRGRALLAYSHVDEAEKINTVNGFAGTSSIGEDLFGWYVELGYDVLTHAKTEQQLSPFFRMESINTQESVPTGFAADGRNDDRIYTAGLSYNPIPNVAVKSDYRFHRDGAGTGVDQVNVALAYLF